MRVASDGCILGFGCNTERTAHSASSSKLEATHPQDARLEFCEGCTACLATVATCRPQTTTSSTTCNRPQEPLGLMCGNCSVRTQTLDLPPKQHLFSSTPERREGVTGCRLWRFRTFAGSRGPESSPFRQRSTCPVSERNTTLKRSSLHVWTLRWNPLCNPEDMSKSSPHLCGELSVLLQRLQFETSVAIARVVIQMNARWCRLVLTDAVRSTKISNAIITVLTLGWTDKRAVTALLPTVL